MTQRFILCLSAAVLLLAGCQAQTPVSNPETVQVQKCGPETVRHGDGYDATARECLWQAVNAGKPASFTTTSYTVEGDPITYTIQALAASHGPGRRFTVLVDSKDKFGKQGRFNYACHGISRAAYQQMPNTNSAAQRFGFSFYDCTGNDDSTEVNVP